MLSFREIDIFPYYLECVNHVEFESHALRDCVKQLLCGNYYFRALIGINSLSLETYLASWSEISLKVETRTLKTLVSLLSFALLTIRFRDGKFIIIFLRIETIFPLTLSLFSLKDIVMLLWLLRIEFIFHYTFNL